MIGIPCPRRGKLLQKQGPLNASQCCKYFAVQSSKVPFLFTCYNPLLQVALQCLLLAIGFGAIIVADSRPLGRQFPDEADFAHFQLVSVYYACIHDLTVVIE